ncbi:hypothetical protein FIBSPDRAFT_846234 [Athelia psychrophila]|uniref:BAG domain-containing protein n=1 Tax=Athelia psychrophila TaxID=1759441 RepID=A0A166WUV8_9AGAM|nr:hypothetical protein FIBSPDRAFT_846234 [Fibularhizoctonia sp. CBS 109695]
MSILVKWGRERLHIPLPPPETKLGDVRKALADYTHLPANSFKLIHAGAVMKDDNAPLSAYALRANSTIALIAPPAITSSSAAHQKPSAQANRPPQKKREEPKTEQNTITAIHAEVNKVRSTLLPDVNAFLSTLTRPAPAAAAAQPQAGYRPPPAQRVLGQLSPAQNHTRLSELLLQVLLKLDAITPEGAWEQARRERKGAVREVQGVLDRLDGEWSERAR